MGKTKTTFLTLALVFVGLTIALFAVTVYYASNTLYLIYHDKPNIVDVFAGLILWAVVIMYATFTMVAAGGILPFDLLLINKCKVKTWYTKVILIFAITMIVLSFISMLGLPIASSIYRANHQSSSSISSSM